MASPPRKRVRSMSSLRALPLKPVLRDGKLVVALSSDIANSSRHTASVEFSEPGPEEECMITMDKIDSCFLDFLPGQTFSQEHPALKKATLNCGHSFSGMAVVWHFLSNNMRCPCCRAGSDSRLSPSCLPSHFKDLMMQKYELDHLAAKAEEERDNLFTAISIFMEGEDVGPSLDVFFSTLSAVLTVYWFDAPDSPCPCVVSEYPLETCLSGSPGGATWPSSSGSFSFHLQRHQARTINHALGDMGDSVYMELVLSTRSATNDVIELDRTPRLQLSETASLEAPNLKISLLEGGTARAGIEAIQWSVPRETFAFRLGRHLGAMFMQEDTE